MVHTINRHMTNILDLIGRIFISGSFSIKWISVKLEIMREQLVGWKVLAFQVFY